MSLAEQIEPRPRPNIGRYAVTGRIGRGGMGMVYRGLDEALEREVAVKTLTVEGALDDESRRRFEIEAKAAAKLQHPNIITVFELGEDRGVPFIAMELLPGVDLEAMVRSKDSLLLQEKLEIVVQVLRGLAFAHEHGIVHRDIKPSNIRLLDDGSVKILDFGIAKLAGTGVTRTGMMVGTVNYMSPEQIRGQRLDGRSDVFSVGVILHELLAGQRPFHGQSPTQVLYKIVNEPHAPVEDLGEVGPRLQAIVDRALAKDPAERYAGAVHMADDLLGFLADCSSVATPEQTEEVSHARGLLKQGKQEEGVQELRAIVERFPTVVEARRALRAATREMSRRGRSAQLEAEEFPELAATFQASPTQREPETVVLGVGTEPIPSRRGVPAVGRWLLAAAGAGLAVAVAAGAFLLRQADEAPPVASPHRIPVRSQPPGAAVLVGGEPTGVVTDGVLELSASETGIVALTFRKPGHRDETRTLRLPLSSGEVVAVALKPSAATLAVGSEPPGATVVLDGETQRGTTPLDVTFEPATEAVLQVSMKGYKSQEVRLLPGELPDQVRVTLEPLGPPGTVHVISSYPVAVFWKGERLARGRVSPRVSLPAGRQLLSLVSREYFLNSRLTVDVRAGGEADVQAPGLGRISIRASPGNCKIFIGGSFVDYPPISERPIVAGAHKVVFEWPDGTRREKLAEVSPGGIAYVTGRKE